MMLSSGSRLRIFFRAATFLAIFSNPLLSLPNLFLSHAPKQQVNEDHIPLQKAVSTCGDERQERLSMWQSLPRPQT
jgi:hypothetical protein